MVTSSFLPGRGGIESYLAELCATLAPRLAVMAASERDGKRLPDDLPYPVFGQPRSMLVPSGKLVGAVSDLARRLSTDKVLFGTPWPLALMSPSLSERGLRYAVIVHGAEMLVPAAAPILRQRFAHALGGAELLLPVSDFTRSRLEGLLRGHGLPIPDIERLRARVDLERFRPDVDVGVVAEQLGVDPAAPVVLCFGRLVERKGVHRLLKVWPSIKQRAPRAALVIAGTGPELKKLQQKAHPLRDVYFAGRVAEEHAAAYYARGDVFALPVVDRWFGLELEGLGVVLLEAAACGTACVTGTSGGTPEAVVDGETGYVIDAGDPVRLEESIVGLLNDPGLAARMGTAGRRFVAANYSTAASPRGLLDWLGDDVR